MKKLNPETKAIRRTNLLRLWLKEAMDAANLVTEKMLSESCRGISLDFTSAYVKCKPCLNEHGYTLTVEYETSTGRSVDFKVDYALCKIAVFDGWVHLDYENETVSFSMSDLVDEHFANEELKEVFGDDYDEEESMPEEIIIISMKAFPEFFS